MLKFYLLAFLNLKYVITVVWLDNEYWNTTRQVTTTNGIVQGKEYVSRSGGTLYFRYVGIPYAKPPIGSLRFKSPQPMSNWTGVVDGTSQAGVCCISLDLRSLSATGIDVNGDEDCLYLNVYTPKNPLKQPHKKLASVMMYVHGGAFVTGCPTYIEPDLFMDNGVVLVIPNYRLGMFGYLSTEDMECTGNWAIKDLIAALQWIKINIRKFGGNRRKVTIFGQSAGAVNVNAVLMSPKANGLMHRAILMSGTILSFWGFQTNPKSVAFDVGKGVGIKTKKTRVLIEELRKVPADVLIKSQASFVYDKMSRALINGLPFAPSIEPPHEEAVWMSGSPYELLEKGKYNVIPVMLGVTSLEFLAFYSGLDKLRSYAWFLDTFPKFWVRFSSSWGNKVLMAEKIKHFYFKAKSIIGATDKELLEMLSDDSFRRPMRKMAELIGECTATYFYQFSYESKFGMKSIEGYSGLTKRIFKGVGHTEELAFLFEFPLPGRTDNDWIFSYKLAKIYTNFAKHGNPTPKLDTFLDNASWPKCTKYKVPYLNLDKQFQVIEENFNEENFRFWENVLEEYADKPYIVY